MCVLDDLLGMLQPALPLLAVAASVFLGLIVVRYVLERRLGGTPDANFRIQIAMLALTLAGLLAVITALPVSEALRGQLLSLVGILLSASIALSSTTFLGNAMAGILLRVVGGFKIGDFVSVGEHFGRVSERGLFHTEIQTEDRDLTTLPNLFLISNPVKVVQSSGTIISAHVSLGYDVPRSQIEGILLQAAGKAGLSDPFVHVVDLGDFSVSYRTAGFLAEPKKLLSARSLLRGKVMDELHGAGIEIVSPSFMNTRALGDSPKFIPRPETKQASSAPEKSTGAEDVAFDKADEAEALDEQRTRQQALAREITEAEEQLDEAASDSERQQSELRLAAAKAEHEQLVRALERAEEKGATGE